MMCILFNLSTPARARSFQDACPANVNDGPEVVSTDSELLSGVAAYGEGRYDDAEWLFKRSARRDETEAEAYYLLARLYLEPIVNRPAGASRYIRQALDIEPDNLRYLRERLRQLGSGLTFFMGTEGDREHTAERILEVDSLSAAGHEDMGVVDMAQFLRYRGLLATNFNNRLVRMAEEKAESAQFHLEKSLSLDRCRRSVYEKLIRLYVHVDDFGLGAHVLATMRESFPDDRQTWLLSGMVAYHEGNNGEARTFFDRALQPMSTADRQTFMLEKYILSEEESTLYDANPTGFRDTYWRSRRPRYLTEQNERVLAHYARLVYSDLLFSGWREHAMDGWLITPGEVILRYGIPLRESTWIDTEDFLSRYLTLQFEGIGGFSFTDFFRNGDYFLMGSALIPARDTIHRQPESYAYEGPGRKVDFPFLATVFRSLDELQDDRADVYITMGIPIQFDETDSTQTPEPGKPLDLSELNVEVGSFLIDSTYQVVAQRKQNFFGLSPGQLLDTSDGMLWTTTHRLAASPGPLDISVEFETLTRTVLGATPGVLTVPSYRDSTLMISDLMLALNVEEADPGESRGSNFIERNGVSIQPAPWGVFSPDQPIYIYFETYNMGQDQGGVTQTEIEVVLLPRNDQSGITAFFNRIFRRPDQPGVSVRATYSGSSRDDGQYLIIDASNQPTGEYVLMLRVEDRISGSTRVTQRNIVLE